MLQKKNVSRRQFLKKASIGFAGAIGFPYIISSSALGKGGSVVPSNRIVMGCIGLGNMGRSNMRNFMSYSDTQVVAVCDVRGPQRERAQRLVNERYGKKVCAAYNDFRELCARDDIDAVSVVSTDHWHVLHALEAGRTGKDLFVEKPLGLSVEQDKVLRDVVHRYGLVFQFGTLQRSMRFFPFACELVLNGRIGKVHTIKVGEGASLSSENFPPMPVPDWLDYDLWLGPAPWAPYTDKRVNTWKRPWGEGWEKYWWHISDYALGFIAGCGIHNIDTAQWGNGTDLTGPVEVEGTAEFPRDGLCDCATGWDVKLKYANGVEMSFTDSKKNKYGILFEGTDGWVFVKRRFMETHPKSLMEEKIGPDEIHLPRSNNHCRNFVDAVKTRSKPMCPIDVAVRSDTICHLSDIATRLGRKLHWDPEKEEFINDATANQMLKRAMRSPWHL